MRYFKHSKTCGALKSRFERDRVFSVVDTVAGPGVMPSGAPNADLSLRFGTYMPIGRPHEWRIWRAVFLYGENAALWARLSVFESAFLVFSERFAIRFR